MAEKLKIDIQSVLTATEVGRIVTHFRQQDKRIKYRELIGFSPAEAAETASAKKFNITAEQIARAAGRPE